MRRYEMGEWPEVCDEFKRLFKVDAREFLNWRLCYDNRWNVILDKKAINRYMTLRYKYRRLRIQLPTFILRKFGIEAYNLYKRVTL